MKTVVFVHGMFVTPRCWQAWRARFEARGYRTLAPAWPEHEGEPAALRAAHPNPALAKLTLADLVEHHRQILRGLPDKPFLVGHSMGGLLVQLLLQEALGAAGVAIDSAPPKGVISLAWSFLKSNWPAINPFASADAPIFLDEAAFAYAFTNTLPRAAQQSAWAEQCVPESRRVGKGPTTATAAIDFTRPHPPLLLIAGGADHIIPPALNRKNHARYRGDSLTELREFPGRDHYTLDAPGWEEVADYTLDWLAARS